MPTVNLVGRPVFKRSFAAISRHALALFCGASGDHNPIHVDLDFARASGFQDVFAHGMLVMAYLGQALEEAGPLEGIRSFSVRFASITQLGAIITCEGHVDCVEADRTKLALRAIDQAGDLKLTGQATVDTALWSRSWSRV
jgi:acyl dehydratase